MIGIFKRGLYHALDGGTIGDAAGCWHTDLNAAASGIGGDAGDG